MEKLEYNVNDIEKRRLYAAKIYVLLAFTSCGWFFDGDERPEREIPRQMAEVVGKLLRDEYRAQRQDKEVTVFTAT